MKGISPLISFVITVALISVATTIVLTVITPTFNRLSDSTVLNEGEQNLELISSAIKQVSSESQNSKRTIDVVVSEGEYGINATNDYIYFKYDTKTDYAREGIVRDVRFDQSPVFIEYFNNYVQSTTPSGWTVKNGTWATDSGEYSGQNGLAYYHYGSLGQFAIEGWITNKSGVKAEAFVLPVSPNDLRGYWTFDEGVGLTVWDYSGYNNTGNFSNYTQSNCGTNGACPSWDVGKSDYGLYFDGKGDYVDLGNALNLDIVNNLTISMWVKIPQRPQSGLYYYLFSRYQTWRVDGYTLRMSDTGRIGLVTGGAWQNDSSNTANTAVDDNNWHHVVVTFQNSTLTTNTYIDGILDSTKTSCNPLVSAGAYHAYFGRDYIINGTIDEVMIFNTSLSASQIKSLYETSWKKISSTGKSDTIAATTDTYLALVTPYGHTHFDEIKIKTNTKQMQLSIPFSNVDLNGTAKFSKGSYSLTITHKGTNSTVSKPIIELMVA